MLKQSNCKSYEIPDDTGGCSAAPQTLRVINSSNGALTFLRCMGDKYVPYSFSSGSVDYIPSKSKNSRDNVVYYLSRVNEKDMHKNNSPYVLTLFDEHNIEVGPNPDYNGEHPGYQLELYQNNRKRGNLFHNSSPIIVSTVPGGVIVVKISSQPGYGNGQPGYGNGQPGYGNGQPGYGNGQPGYGNGQPGYGNGQPVGQIPPATNPNLPSIPPQEPEGTITYEPERGVSFLGTSAMNSTLQTLDAQTSALQSEISSLGASVNNLNAAASQLTAAAENRKTIWTWIAVGIGAIFVLLLIGFLVFFFMNRGKKEKETTIIEEVV